MESITDKYIKNIEIKEREIKINHIITTLENKGYAIKLINGTTEKILDMVFEIGDVETSFNRIKLSEILEDRLL